MSEDSVLYYHERTKHQFGRYARSLGYLDWANQPDPFRAYAGAPRHRLAEVPPEEGNNADALYTPATPACGLDAAFLAQLLYDALALSAWKQLGDSRWSLRANPSSGNLHPTEAYLLLDTTPELHDAPALYHYAPLHHALERLTELAPADYEALVATLPRPVVLCGLTSIHWREAWKYGERAYRYCQHDVGHAVACLSFAGAPLGWRARLLEGVSDGALARLLGVDGQEGPEAEHPDALVALYPADARVDDAALAAWAPPAPLVAKLRPHEHAPNRLSARHHDWPVIDRVAETCEKPAEAPLPPRGEPLPALDVAPPTSPQSARALVRGRRSAQAMDGATRLPADTFYRIAARLLPAVETPPFDALPWWPAVHAVFFVHRVDGVPPGLYVLSRGAERDGPLGGDCAAAERPVGCPESLPLRVLRAGDVRDAARLVSCAQDIASDGAFAVAMIAPVAEHVEAFGPWFYRALHWEAGAIGQVLYLEAEAAGLRGTGIGCFFDDEVTALFELDGRPWQSLYHFTVGGAVNDARLQTLPAYHHRSEAG